MQTTVAGGLHRLGAPEGAHGFYAMHAEADPLHGRRWLDNDWAERSLITAVPA